MRLAQGFVLCLALAGCARPPHSAVGVAAQTELPTEPCRVGSSRGFADTLYIVSWPEGELPLRTASEPHPDYFIGREVVTDQMVVDTAMYIQYGLLDAVTVQRSPEAARIVRVGDSPEGLALYADDSSEVANPDLYIPYSPICFFQAFRHVSKIRVQTR